MTVALEAAVVMKLPPLLSTMYDALGLISSPTLLVLERSARS